ncbi:MAG: mechanosensitive ion channel [Bacteroidales bacterium]|nr:mechanosensitive ion channel [Bacteroidales bacterium]
MISADKILDEGIKLVVSYGPKLLLAIVFLFGGFWIIKKLTKLIAKLMEKRNVDVSLRSFLHSIINVALKILLIISVLQMVGVETTSFVAMLGAAGLAIGMALQGSLSNFAGGVLILLFKPYKVGDLIEAQGYTGTVDDIQIFTTKLKTAQGRIIIIPNAALSNGNIVNHTVNGINRVDIMFSIDYNADIDTAKQVLLDVAKSAKGALSDPEPVCVVYSLGDSSVNIRQSTYCNPPDYWDIYFYNMEQGKKALDKAGVNIPFPQMDVFIKNKLKKETDLKGSLHFA